MRTSRRRGNGRRRRWRRRCGFALGNLLGNLLELGRGRLWCFLGRRRRVRPRPRVSHLVDDWSRLRGLRGRLLEGNWRRRGVGECRLWLVSLRQGRPERTLLRARPLGTTTHGSTFGGAAAAGASAAGASAAGASASSDELESSSSSSSSSLSSSVLESGGESGGLGMGFAPGLLAKRRLGLSGVCLRGGEGRSGSQLADAVRPAADAVPRGRGSARWPRGLVSGRDRSWTPSRGVPPSSLASSANRHLGVSSPRRIPGAR